MALKWYRTNPAIRGLVLQYYQLLRSILQARPSLRQCLTRCWRCRIFFLTHPRNAGRSHLGCPFGCREAHRKAASNQRSLAYYQTDDGRKRKQALNQRRFLLSARASPLPPPPTPPEPIPWPVTIVKHVQQVVSWIEGRALGWPEVLSLLRRIVRQHRIVRQPRRDQVVAWLNEFPP